MNHKKEKLISEKSLLLDKIETNSNRIEKMKSRIAEIDKIITSITNSEYGEIMEAYNMTPEELAELLEKTKMKGKNE